jgi:hypothetical protein
LWAFVDHGSQGTGEPPAVLLRAGNAGSNTAADHLVVIQEALRQLPFPTSGRIGRKVLVRIDGAGLQPPGAQLPPGQGHVLLGGVHLAQSHP